MNLTVAVSLEAVYTHSVHLKKTSIFPYTLLKLFVVRDG